VKLLEDPQAALARSARISTYGFRGRGRTFVCRRSGVFRQVYMLSFNKCNVYLHFSVSTFET
jgi:hypothetical protein